MGKSWLSLKYKLNLYQRFYLTLSYQLKLIQRRIKSKYTYIANQEWGNKLVINAKLTWGDKSIGKFTCMPMENNHWCYCQFSTNYRALK